MWPCLHVATSVKVGARKNVNSGTFVVIRTLLGMAYQGFIQLWGGGCDRRKLPLEIPDNN